MYSKYMELDERLIQKVTSYKPSLEAVAHISTTPILFVVGITGAGKDTIQRNLVAAHQNEYRFIVSHTTRAPRENHGTLEQDGVDYHFVDFAQIDQMIDNKQFVEAKVVHFDNVYGTSIAEIEAAQREDKIAITDIEVKGVREYVDLGMNVKPVFLLPPSYEVWWERLTARYSGKMLDQDLRKRMQTALMEIEHAVATDYFYIVINDDLNDTVDLVNRIAHGEAVEPHYHKAMDIAEQFLQRMREKLATTA
jgi:guanylate kinase